MTQTLRDKIAAISAEDLEALLRAEKSYGDSWKRRGGVGAFMMLARKWDRLENQVGRVLLNGRTGQLDPESKWNIFMHAMTDRRTEGIIDDIRDLRRYLLLVETELWDQQSLAAIKGGQAEEPSFLNAGRIEPEASELA